MKPKIGRLGITGRDLRFLTFCGGLVGRPVAMIIIAVIKAIASAKKQASHRKKTSENEQDEFDIHDGCSFMMVFWRLLV